MRIGRFQKARTKKTMHLNRASDHLTGKHLKLLRHLRHVPLFFFVLFVLFVVILFFSNNAFSLRYPR